MSVSNEKPITAQSVSTSVRVVQAGWQENKKQESNAEIRGRADTVQLILIHTKIKCTKGLWDGEADERQWPEKDSSGNQRVQKTGNVQENKAKTQKHQENKTQ